MGPVAKMYAFRGALIHRPYHVLIHCLGHEGGEGGGYQRHGLEHGVEGHVGGLLIGGHILAPVPLAAAADVPVGKVVHEVLHLAARLGHLQVVKVCLNVTHEGVQAGKYPPVHGGQVFAHQLMPGGVEVIYVRIQYIEGVGIPEGSHVLALALGYGLCGEAVGQPGHGAGVEIPAHSVCALIVQEHPGIYYVAYVLAHLSAFLLYR